jgi:hypothetical protein
LQIHLQASLQVSFQKPHHPGKPGVTRVFLDANSILDLAQSAKKQDHSRSERAMFFHNPVQARL